MPPPLTDQQIRKLFEEVISDTVEYKLIVLSYQKLLLNAGLVTKSQIDEAFAEAKAEAKEALKGIHQALNQPPAGGVQ